MELETLVVIDMQEGFHTASHYDTNLAVEREIARARDLGHSIIFVEYENYGDTNLNLRSIAHDYDRLHVISKSGDDGSCEVMDCILKNNLPRTLRVCGVNGDACVYLTLCGLASKVHKFPVIAVVDAINSHQGKNKTLEICKTYLAKGYAQQLVGTEYYKEAA